MRPTDLRTTPIPTIPLIPSHWKVARNKEFMREVNRPSRDGTEEMLSVSHITGVTRRSEKTVNMFEAESTVGYKVVNPGDLVINTMWAWMGAAGVSSIKGIVSPAYGVYQIDADRVDPGWIDTLVRTPAYITEMTRWSRGVTSSRLRLYPDEFLRLSSPIPPLDEQRAILREIDQETARIDALIAAKRRMIEVLAVKRQATIDAAMLGVGQRVRVRHLVNRVTSGPRGWAEYVADTGVPFLRITNVNARDIELDLSDLLFVQPPVGAERNRTTVVEGDVLVSITAEIGSVGVARAIHAGAAVSQHIALLTPVRCSGDWLAYGLITSAAKAQLEAGRYGGTKTQLSLDDVRDVEIEVVPADSEAAIGKAVAGVVDAIKRANRLLVAQIDLLVEHRQALITAAVTGGLDVEVAA